MSKFFYGSKRVRLRSFCLSIGAAFWLSPAISAVTIVPPANIGELAATSDAVVVVRAVESLSSHRGRMILTTSEVVVEERLSGNVTVGDILFVRCPGGTVDGERWTVPGVPNFAKGKRYFVCLHASESNPSHEPAEAIWIPSTFAYGVLEEVLTKNGEALFTPIAESRDLHTLHSSDAVEPLGSYHKRNFLNHLAQVLDGSSEWDADRVTAHRDPPHSKGVPEICEFIPVNGRNSRWRVFDSGGVISISGTEGGDLSLPGGGLRELADATSAWMHASDSSLNILFEGEVEFGVNCQTGGQRNAVTFNDPCSDIAPLQSCSGVLAFGGPFQTGSPHPFDGQSWETITSWLVVVNDGSDCLGSTGYRRMLTHELGHGLGYAHVDDTNALMFANCCNNINSTDRQCLEFSYPTIDASNQRPRVDAGEDLDVALAGNSLVLRANVSDDGKPTNNGLETRWRQLAGPAPVTFENPTGHESRVSFSQSGDYVFGLSAYDGERLDTDAISVTAQIFATRSGELTFEQGSGYSGTVDTYLRESQPNLENNLNTVLVVDNDEPSNSGLKTQTLLRFDGIFGEATNSIPPNVTISSATLSLTSDNNGVGASIHRMLHPWGNDNTWSTFDGDGIQTGLEAHEFADDIVSGLQQVVVADVTRSLQAWSANPCLNFGWVFLPLGNDGWDFRSAESFAPPRLTVRFSAFNERSLIRPGDDWLILTGNNRIPGDWNHPGFVPDPDWISGPTGIGYGDGDDATILQDMRNNYVTIFCRREFIMDETLDSALLLLRIDYDDGFIAYLNGVEVARSASMGSTETPSPNFTTIFSREAGVVTEFFLDPSALRSGINVLAVEVHNSNVGSSDLTFIPELIYSPFLVGPGDSWRFLRGSQTIPSNWQLPELDDSNWETGSGVGYGDGDDETILDDMQGNYLSVFLRKDFEITKLSDLLINLIHDDGAVVYFNGTEIGRANMPTGNVDRNTPALSSVETMISSLVVPQSLVKIGSNQLAVSVHNVSLDSNDLSFHAVVGPTSPSGRRDCSPAIRRGDVDANSEVDITDALQILMFLFVGNELLSCEDAADWDDNGKFDISDVIRLLQFQFMGTTPPAEPGTECGEDPTTDTLNECEITGCQAEKRAHPG